MTDSTENRPSWCAKLDAAIMDKFEGVECRTEHKAFSGKPITKWWAKRTKNAPVPMGVDARIRDFLAGYMICLRDMK